MPERRAPCFFNPQHGPSVRDVRWAPPGGAPRDVPACAADAQRVEQGFDPHVREVMIDGQRRPYYDAGPAYAPYAYGYYGGFGDVMTGMLVGTMLGSMIGGGFGFGGFGAGYSAGYAEGLQDARRWRRLERRRLGWRRRHLGAAATSAATSAATGSRRAAAADPRPGGRCLVVTTRRSATHFGPGRSGTAGAVAVRFARGRRREDRHATRREDRAAEGPREVRCRRT